MDIKAQILTLLSKGEPMKTSEIAVAINADKAVVEKAIKQLKDSGEVISPKRCFYALK
ncbi:ArsR family transcriptional regulator [Campylobacter sp. faydin G-24]|uniref:ArsR family transcriptional regulator n=1 Tax=Campylobacter anatolicus TaxID=2829105 RepID=A0ABS5HH13_9BACT|nr:HTH domain-containing protein [Campylobacter anatolicus]MBR8463336.1 ArsR family transcriptional regulator [Campylobacter anatolicus]